MVKSINVQFDDHEKDALDKIRGKEHWRKFILMKGLGYLPTKPELKQEIQTQPKLKEEIIDMTKEQTEPNKTENKPFLNRG